MSARIALRSIDLLPYLDDVKCTPHEGFEYYNPRFKVFVVLKPLENVYFNITMRYIIVLILILYYDTYSYIILYYLFLLILYNNTYSSLLIIKYNKYLYIYL